MTLFVHACISPVPDHFCVLRELTLSLGYYCPPTKITVPTQQTSGDPDFLSFIGIAGLTGDRGLPEPSTTQAYQFPTFVEAGSLGAERFHSALPSPSVNASPVGGTPVFDV